MSRMFTAIFRCDGSKLGGDEDGGRETEVKFYILLLWKKLNTMSTVKCFSFKGL
jgi:hypothetical protein